MWTDGIPNAGSCAGDRPIMHSKRPLIVGLGGSIRPNAISERAISIALEHVARRGCRTQLLGHAEMPLELFDPATRERSERAHYLVDSLRQADGLIIATPSYHCGVSGLIKNAIDFIEDLRNDERPYLEGRAVGIIVCADGLQAIGSTISSLRDIIHALRGWPTPYAASILNTGHPFGSDGQESDPAALRACQLVADEVFEFTRMKAFSTPGFAQQQPASSGMP